MTVGRRQGADLVLAHDPCLSGLHFAIDWHSDDSIVVRDLNSTNGIAVNDVCRSEAVVTAQDRIRAGKHLFAIAFERNGESAVLDRSKDFANVAYHGEALASGLYRFEPTGAVIAPADLASRIEEHHPLLLIAHLGALGVEPPQSDIELAYICDWYPAERLAELSPVLLGCDDPLDRFDLIAKGWGKNALVCLFTRSPKETLLSHLRGVVRGQERAEVPPPEGQMTGFCWPALLAGLLEFGDPQTVDFWFTGVAAVLLEAAPPVGWQVYSRAGFHEVLEHMGFREEMPRTATL